MIFNAFLCLLLYTTTQMINLIIKRHFINRTTFKGIKQGRRDSLRGRV